MRAPENENYNAEKHLNDPFDAEHLVRRCCASLLSADGGLDAANP
jgi:hypothetical protein